MNGPGAQDRMAASDPRPTGRLLGGLLLVVLGSAWLFEALDVFEVPWGVLLATVLVGVGVILVVNARTGRSQGGLIGLGAALAALLLLSAAVDLPLGGGVGDRSVRPTTLADVDRPIELAVGQLRVDLRTLVVGEDGSEPVVIRVRVGIGKLEVIVPEGVPVLIEGRAGLGSVKTFGREADGFDVDRTDGPDAGVDPVWELRLSVGIGEVTVERG